MPQHTPPSPGYDLLAAFLLFLVCVLISLFDTIQGIDIDAFAGLYN